MTRRKVLPPPPGDWSLQYIDVLAEAEIAAGELTSSAEASTLSPEWKPGSAAAEQAAKLRDFFSSDDPEKLQQLVSQLLETAGGCIYAAQQLRHYLNRRKAL